MKAKEVLVPKSAVPTHAFIYGRAVRPHEFLDRESELRTIFNRLRHGESSAIVGEPHIGKTSLLLKLADRGTQEDYLGEDAHCLVVSELDLQPVQTDYTPAVFWEEVLESLRKKPGHRSITQGLDLAVQAGYTRRSLERLFNSVGKQGRRLVLLLDEFDRLLTHPNFQDPAFFALLRSLATRTGGLALIPASRSSVAAMNQMGCNLLDIGSPFFNNVIEVRLHPFDEEQAEILLQNAGDALSLNDRRFARRVAGRHPFLLQAMAAFLIGTIGDDRHARAAQSFYECTSFHFDDLWRALDDRSRTAAVILSLLEFGGRALGQDFAFGEIENIEAFGPELQRLEESGLAEKVRNGWQFDRQHLLLWRGERWTIGAQAFAWWTRDVVIAQTRRVPSFDEWLVNKRYRFILTQEQWDWLVQTVRKAPQWAVGGVEALARTLFGELVKR